MMKTLADWLPNEYRQNGDTHLDKYMDQIIIRETAFGGWVGTHKNVRNWCLLKNGMAVGWNESPSRGHSFPKKNVGHTYDIHNRIDLVEDFVLANNPTIDFDLVGGTRKYYVIDSTGEKKHGSLFELVLFGA